MSDRQGSIQDRIKALVAASAVDEITYKSEWLGYLPFGAFHWIEHQGKDVSSDFPAGWTLEDLTGLERCGFLEVLETHQDPEDEFDRWIRYRVCVTRP
ncbi:MULTISPECIES: hypothetical protein [Pseudomonas]|uniref:Uncharacterized protein n=1 Tax=Pseudomonas asplenii TaxID=53407 RepID=A0A0M9GCU7_9PSED|nr:MULTISPECIES: hypothetical protein [Pseudomonas]KPA87935.1 hypothetical protein PF66_05512 [Pseudomonas fuscovaginae]KPA95593.1 hypothetical protein PF70_04426 [Pseudomonas fuscovaginae]